MTYSQGIDQELWIGFLQLIGGTVIANREYPHDNYHSHAYYRGELNAQAIRDRLRRYCKKYGNADNKTSKLFSVSEAKGTYEQNMQYLHKGPLAEKVNPKSSKYKLSSQLPFDRTEIIFNNGFVVVDAESHYRHFWVNKGQSDNVTTVEDIEAKTGTKTWTEKVVEQYDKFLSDRYSDSQITTRETLNFILDRYGEYNKGFDDQIVIRVYNVLLWKYSDRIEDGKQSKDDMLSRLMTKIKYG